MSSLIVGNVSTPVKMKSAQLELSTQLKVITAITVLLALAVIGLACYGLFGTPLIATQLMIWIMSASMTLEALICSCAKYHLLRRYEKNLLSGGEPIQ
ncbi:hypothetical protein [Chlamydia caviae]|uniref:Uncharacterized protein n=1 Tax=Chlamydia caviae (strain ATCC VR-813 / DSM 19441 / 03DC25 / GPIC) TaxID=227941 RepID=Q823P7_CHLCV|nr:hypothetical protein [Chlamydia caviae]AAP05108.1 conserved hypothetical protein [Chlamydia caviae GPIC]